jgi:hypothetical protein
MELDHADETQSLGRLRRILANQRVAPSPEEEFVPLDGAPVRLYLGANRVLRLVERAPSSLSLVAVSLHVAPEVRAKVVQAVQARNVKVWGIRKNPEQIGSLIGGLGRSSCVMFAFSSGGSSADALSSVRDYVCSRLTVLAPAVGGDGGAATAEEAA